MASRGSAEWNSLTSSPGNRPHTRLCLFLKQKEKWNKVVTLKGTILFWQLALAVYDIIKEQQIYVTLWLWLKIRLFHLTLPWRPG